MNWLLDPEREFLLSLPSPCVSETHMKVWNIGNVVKKAMLKGTNVADTDALETPIIDP